MPAAAFAPRAADQPLLRSEWHLSTEHSLLMRVERGDRLRVLHGTVWIAAEGRGRETVLVEGGSLVAAQPGVLWMVGRDAPRVVVHSHQPPSVGTRADYGAWRQHTAAPCAVRPRAARFIDALADLWHARPARALAQRA